MNKTEYLLQRLAEECNEVAVECSKANLYGLDDKVTFDPDGPRGTEGPTNREKIAKELNDLLGVARLLVTEGILPADWHDANAQIAKGEKVRAFMRYSVRVGALPPSELIAMQPSPAAP